MVAIAISRVAGVIKTEQQNLDKEATKQPRCPKVKGVGFRVLLCRVWVFRVEGAKKSCQNSRVKQCGVEWIPRLDTNSLGDPAQPIVWIFWLTPTEVGQDLPIISS